MNLSRLTLNPRNAASRRDVARPYEMHRTLCRAFAHADAACSGKNGQPPENRILFRIEPEPGRGGPVVLVQSEDVEPRWQPLLENEYLLRADGPKGLDPTLKKDQALRFRLVANPTKKVNGSRVPLTYDEKSDDMPDNFQTYWDWLHRRAEMAGFEVVQTQDVPFRSASNRVERNDYDKHQIPHFGVRFDGLLRVINPNDLSDALRKGIGSAKAFGFGLLTLAPAI